MARETVIIHAKAEAIDFRRDRPAILSQPHQASRDSAPMGKAKPEQQVTEPPVLLQNHPFKLARKLLVNLVSKVDLLAELIAAILRVCPGHTKVGPGHEISIISTRC